MKKNIFSWKEVSYRICKPKHTTQCHLPYIPGMAIGANTSIRLATRFVNSIQTWYGISKFELDINGFGLFRSK